MLILTDQSIYHSIADAIRECLETSETYFPAEMPDEIRRIPMRVHVTAGPFEMAGYAPCHGIAHRQTVTAGLGNLTFTIDADAPARKV